MEIDGKVMTESLDIMYLGSCWQRALIPFLNTHTHILYIYHTLQINMYNIVLHVPFIQAAKRCKYLVQPGCLKSYCDGLIAIGSSYSIKPHRFWSPEKLNIWVLIQLCIEGIGRISHIVLISSDILWWYVSWWWISNGYQLIVFNITSDFWASLVDQRRWCLR